MTGTVVWVTGASSGLGKEAAAQLARRGYSVAVTARNADALNDLADTVNGSLPSDGSGGRIAAFPADLTDQGAAETVVAEIEDTLGPITLAILNAGTHIPVSMDNLTVDPFRKLLDVNVMGTVHCLVPAARRMIDRRSGHIAIVSSVAGYSGLPTASAYGASKAALINMAEALKLDLEPYGVRVRIVNPGFVRTPLTDKNPFPMPFLMDVEPAARRMIDGLLSSNRFEITFPRRFTYGLKVLRCLPRALYFAIVRRATKGAKG